MSRYPYGLTTAVPHVYLGTGMDGRLLGPPFQVFKCRGCYFVCVLRKQRDPKDPKDTGREGNTADKSGQCDVFLEHGPGHPPGQRSPRTTEHRISNMGNMGLRGLRTLSPSICSTPPTLGILENSCVAERGGRRRGGVVFRSFQGFRGFHSFRPIFLSSRCFCRPCLSLAAV